MSWDAEGWEDRTQDKPVIDRQGRWRRSWDTVLDIINLPVDAIRSTRLTGFMISFELPDNFLLSASPRFWNLRRWRFVSSNCFGWGSLKWNSELKALIAVASHTGGEWFDHGGDTKICSWWVFSCTSKTSPTLSPVSKWNRAIVIDNNNATQDKTHYFGKTFWRHVV